MNVREAVFKVVYEVLYRKGYSNIVLENMQSSQKFSRRDSAFLTNAVLGTLRNSLYLEYIISAYSNIKYNKIAPAAIVALKISAYQILFMDRVPDSAACNEGVKIAGKYVGQRAKGFINAVLRKISREKENIGALLKKLPPEKYLSVKYSCSILAVKKLTYEYGAEDCEHILENMNKPAKLCIRCFENPEPGFKEKGILYEKGTLARNAYYLVGSGAAASLDIFKNGLAAVMDEGAQYMSEFVAPKPGQMILDACAAPGGKSMHMAWLMKGKGKITACDINQHRIENMKKNIDRTKVENIVCCLMDMTKKHHELTKSFDKVLLDVPCSGLGTSQRRPEIKLLYKENSGLCKLQGKILKTCADYVKPGGELIYGTCTLFREENRDIVDEFLAGDDRFCIEEERVIVPDGMKGGFYMMKMKRIK